MTLVLALLLLAPTQFPTNLRYDAIAQIEGGSTVRSGEFEFAVWIKNRVRPNPHCTGSVIAPRWVMTAAHCMEASNQTILFAFAFEVLIGRSHASARSVLIERIIVHEDFRNPVIYPDVALLELSEPVAVEPVGLLDMEDERRYASAGADAVLIGGGGGAHSLQQAPFTIASTCPLRAVTDQVVCINTTSRRNPEPGDSGGPLVVQLPNGRWTQAGITKGDEVGGSFNVAPLTRIATVHDWIVEQTGTSDQEQPVGDHAYYFPHLAVGAGWQTAMIYVNHADEAVTCQTSFIASNGTPLSLSMQDGGTLSERTDHLPPRGTLYDRTNVGPSADTVSGWAHANCTAPVKASLLYRYHDQEGQPVGEASVPAMAVPATRLVTFAQKQAMTTGTGIAVANPSQVESAYVAFTVRPRETPGRWVTVHKSVGPRSHAAFTIADLFGLIYSVVGSIEITSDVPVVSLSINTEAWPSFGSLPPGAVD